MIDIGAVVMLIPNHNEEISGKTFESRFPALKSHMVGNNDKIETHLFCRGNQFGIIDAAVGIFCMQMERPAHFIYARHSV